METRIKIKEYVNQVSENEKIDLMIQKTGMAIVGGFEEKLLWYKKDEGVRISISDKSYADIIYETFYENKKTIKKAVGDLYKKRLISLDDKGIELVKS